MKTIINNHEKKLRTKTCKYCKSIIELTSPSDIIDVMGHDTYWSCPQCSKTNSITMKEFPFSWRMEVYEDDVCGH